VQCEVRWRIVGRFQSNSAAQIVQYIELLEQSLRSSEFQSTRLGLSGQKKELSVLNYLSTHSSFVTLARLKIYPLEFFYPIFSYGRNRRPSFESYYEPVINNLSRITPTLFKCFVSSPYPFKVRDLSIV
jgi:hypothetical protein